MSAATSPATARSPIAGQLYNAKEPMTLFELQAWLGHRSPESTQHYAKISPNRLTKAYKDAGYFARNVRTLEVLLDREAVASGAAAAGEPWQHSDLGHGYCTYTFFEQCPHRMACARCDFYTRKDSSKAQLLEANGNLQRMQATIPLTDEEQAAVDDGQAALDPLLERLADVPTPSGTAPRRLLPVTEVRQKNTPPQAWPCPSLSADSVLAGGCRCGQFGKLDGVRQAGEFGACLFGAGGCHPGRVIESAGACQHIEDV